MADGTNQFTAWDYDAIRGNNDWTNIEKGWNRLLRENNIDQVCTDFFNRVNVLLEDINLTRPVSDLVSEPREGDREYPHGLNWVDLVLAGECGQGVCRVCGCQPAATWITCLETPSGEEVGCGPRSRKPAGHGRWPEPLPPRSSWNPPLTQVEVCWAWRMLDSSRGLSRQASGSGAAHVVWVWVHAGRTACMDMHMACLTHALHTGGESWMCHAGNCHRVCQGHGVCGATGPAAPLDGGGGASVRPVPTAYPPSPCFQCPRAMAGTSAGSIAAILLAAERTTPDEPVARNLLSLMLTMPISKFKDGNVLDSSLLDVILGFLKPGTTPLLAWPGALIGWAPALVNGGLGIGDWNCALWALMLCAVFNEGWRRL